MTIKLGVIMDPIDKIHVKKDSTLAMLLEAQNRNWSLHYMEQSDLFVLDETVQARMKLLTVKNDLDDWFTFGDETENPLADLDVILMRLDPPFNMEYIYTTYLLELAEAQGVLVVNKAQSLRDANEKIFTSLFPQCCPFTLITKDSARILKFLSEHKDIMVKDVDSMGGTGVFRIQEGDANTFVLVDVLTKNNTETVIVQKYITDIKDSGDKRILLIDGEPFHYALARIPKPGDIRGNLAAGAKGIGVELTDRDKWICDQVAPVLKEKGLLFVGIDIIGDYLTEINVTSPTCIRDLDAIYDANISAKLLDCIATKVSK